eukprot:12917238-Prorocentrum_lima.AAC.1
MAVRPRVFASTLLAKLPGNCPNIPWSAPRCQVTHWRYLCVRAGMRISRSHAAAKSGSDWQTRATPVCSSIQSATARFLSGWAIGCCACQCLRCSSQ